MYLRHHGQKAAKMRPPPKGDPSPPR